MAIPFTVLMSIYHEEKPAYLKACLKSLEAQTIQPDEFLFIFDGPLSLELEQIVTSFKEKRVENVTLYRFSENRGLGIALAKGVELARNDWIARMDTDDIACNDRFEKQLSYIEAHSEVGLIGSNILEFSKSPHNPTAKRIVPKDNDAIRTFSARRNPFNHMTVMFRRIEVLSAGNYQHLPGYEDYYLWVRMLKNGTIAHNFQENLVYVRANEAMMFRRGGWQYFKQGLKAYNTIYQVGLAKPQDWLVRMFGQIVVNLVPHKIRYKLYKKWLRK